MSGKRAKKIRKLTPAEESVIDENGHVESDNVPKYLMSFFKSYSGYGYISLDPPHNGKSWIKAHRTFAVIDENNTYVSPTCKLIKCISVKEDPEFKGLVVTPTGVGYYGDPFKKMNNLSESPALGEDKFTPSDVSISQM